MGHTWYTVDCVVDAGCLPVDNRQWVWCPAARVRINGPRDHGIRSLQAGSANGCPRRDVMASTDRVKTARLWSTAWRSKGGGLQRWGSTLLDLSLHSILQRSGVSRSHTGAWRRKQSTQTWQTSVMRLPCRHLLLQNQVLFQAGRHSPASCLLTAWVSTPSQNLEIQSLQSMNSTAGRRSTDRHLEQTT
jgi:hypothetical protein